MKFLAIVVTAALSLGAVSGVALARSSAEAADRVPPTQEEHARQDHPANHGAAVSAVASMLGEKISALAHSTTGPDKGAVTSAAAKMHGEAVSAVAKSDAGKTSHQPTR